MEIFLNRLKLLPAWLSEANPFWIAIFGLGVALGVSCVWLQTEMALRLAGTALQVAGILAVVIDIWKTRRFFGYKPIHKLIVEWIKRFPLFGKNIIIMAGTGIAHGAATASARGHGAKGALGNTVDQRLEEIEGNINFTHERIGSFKKEYDISIRDIKREIKDGNNSTERKQQALQKTIEVVGAGGLKITAVGASWIFVGLILAGGSVEIQRLLN